MTLKRLLNRLLNSLPVGLLVFAGVFIGSIYLLFHECPLYRIAYDGVDRWRIETNYTGHSPSYSPLSHTPVYSSLAEAEAKMSELLAEKAVKGRKWAPVPEGK